MVFFLGWRAEEWREGRGGGGDKRDKKKKKKKKEQEANCFVTVLANGLANCFFTVFFSSLNIKVDSVAQSVSTVSGKPQEVIADVLCLELRNCVKGEVDVLGARPK